MLMGGCAVPHHHGWTGEKTSVTPGMHREDVQKKWGAPSYVSLRGETWVYILCQGTESCLKHRTLKQLDVHTLGFDSKGILKTYTKGERSQVKFTPETTHTSHAGGYEESWGQQIFKNLGRFS